MNEVFPKASIRYVGEAVEDGTIEAEKLGKAVLGLNGAMKKYLSLRPEVRIQNPCLRVSINKGSIEIALYVTAASMIIGSIGLSEFGKAFFGELGRQLALKLFAKNEKIGIEGRPFIKKGKMYRKVFNAKGETREVEVESLDLFNSKYFDYDLAAVVEPLEKKQVDRIQYRFNVGSEINESIEIDESDKSYFENMPELILEDELNKEFNINEADKIEGIRGKLVAYQALASKYPFQFQPREQQKLYGKRFIPCMLQDESRRDEYIELMKSYVGNIIIRGWGIKDTGGRYTRISISSIEKDEERDFFIS